MNLRAVPPLRSTESRDSRIERALSMLTDLMGDEMLPLHARQGLAVVHAEIHACRSPETVARMETKQGLRPTA
jgi:hypothetical protein